MDKDTSRGLALNFADDAAPAGTITINDNSDTVVTGVIPVTKMGSSVTEDFDLGANAKTLSVNTQGEEGAINANMVLARAGITLTIAEEAMEESEALEVSTNVPGHHVSCSITGEGGIEFTVKPEIEQE